jgi:hypothetical protein
MQLKIIVEKKQAYFLRLGVVSPTPNTQARGPLFVGCPRLLIRTYPPCLEAVSSIRNLMTRNAVVTKDPPNKNMRIFITCTPRQTYMK